MSHKSKTASIRLAIDNGDRTVEQPERYRPTALVVEDHRTDGETLLLMLLALEFQCDSVTTAADAIRALNARPYDVIVTEVDLPITLGISVIRSARASPLNFGRPVIVTSTIGVISEGCVFMDLKKIDSI